MGHKYKIGKLIKDKDTIFIKKLLKKNPIGVNGKIIFKDDCIINVTNIRKYMSCVRVGCFVYEVDVMIKITCVETLKYSTGETKSTRLNRRLRMFRNEIAILSELEYFNINDICVSKVVYE
jgi:hypothetical protein